jgi:hypothetical protein
VRRVVNEIGIGWASDDGHGDTRQARCAIVFPRSGVSSSLAGCDGGQRASSKALSSPEIQDSIRRLPQSIAHLAGDLSLP